MSEFWIFVIVGCCAMVASICFFGKRYYQISTGKNVIIAISLSISGIFGALLMNRIESGNWFGASFFGCLIFAPFFMIPLAFALHIPAGDLLDVCTPAGCIMLIILKINCTISGCCRGIILQTLENGYEIRFPSQIVEGINGIVMLLLIIRFMKKKQYKGILYAWSLIYYGATRFLLNIMRDTKPLIWILPGGNFWGLTTIVIGTLTIILFNKKEKVYMFLTTKKHNRKSIIQK